MARSRSTNRTEVKTGTMKSTRSTVAVMKRTAGPAVDGCGLTVSASDVEFVDSAALYEPRVPLHFSPVPLFCLFLYPTCWSWLS
ncbi:hypothetical protein RRG08_004658 [Elysia crispata]|uniref:Uncharacterized protein n=1 Tax=Elysia crispata TaxID=231223 RepID=A0AAE1DK59_9GAST|nr:hypothetical protein RRG08_004658 [Elysia crispata]